MNPNALPRGIRKVRSLTASFGPYRLVKPTVSMANAGDAVVIGCS
jgi:hypothetical protein